MSEVSPIAQQQVQEAQQAEVVNEPQPSSDEIPSDTHFSSVTELQAEYPELYDNMIKGIANTIIEDMKRHQRRFKEIMREASR